MEDALPLELIEGAVLRDGEYAWELSAFPTALAHAPSLGYACLGGQFWFQLPDNSVYELYWLEADSLEKRESETWPEYAERSCKEVSDKFNTLVKATDFAQEASRLPSLEPPFHLLFNAYFVTEKELAALLPEI